MSTSCGHFGDGSPEDIAEVQPFLSNQVTSVSVGRRTGEIRYGLGEGEAEPVDIRLPHGCPVRRFQLSFKCFNKSLLHANPRNGADVAKGFAGDLKREESEESKRRTLSFHDPSAVSQIRWLTNGRKSHRGVAGVNSTGPWGHLLLRLRLCLALAGFHASTHSGRGTA